MLRTIVATVACILVSATMAVAQRPEIFVGYTNLQIEGFPDRNDPSSVLNTDFFLSRSTLHGVNASVTGYNEVGIGLTGDFSFSRRRKSESFTGGKDEQHTDTFYFLGGPTVKFARSSRAQPFIRLMAGVARTNFEASRELNAPAGTTTSEFDVGSTDFAASFGGGLDVRVSDNLKIRVIQVDYAPVFLKDRTVEILGSSGVIQPTTLEGQRQDNFRFSIGLSF